MKRLNGFALLVATTMIGLLAQDRAQASQVNQLNLNGYQLRLDLNQREPSLTVMQQKKILSRLNLRTFENPQVLQWRTFKSQQQNLVTLDYFLGHEENRTTDKECFDVLLFKVKDDGTLQLLQKETYRCDVETDEMRSDEHSFFYPYRINEEKGRIEFTFAPH